ncbi:MAG: SGNH/GDSL hydrolase family protein [Acidimicrobiales bacterium]
MLGLVAGLVLAGPGLLGAEVLLATRGEPAPPLASGIDACVGCDGSGPPLRTVWLGDSTAAGFGAAAADGVVGQQVARRLGRPVDVRVLASGGDTVADVVAQQLPRLPVDAQLVFVSVGANDATHLTRTGTFSSSYRELLAGIPARACLVLLGVPDLGSPPRLAQPLRAVAGWRGRSLDREVRRLARSSGATYVDIAGATGAAFRRDRSLFSPDGYHPADAGYALWAGAVTSAMRSAGLPGGKCP